MKLIKNYLFVFRSERNSKRFGCPFSRRSTIDAMVANTTETLSDVESTKNSTGMQTDFIFQTITM